MKSGSGRAFPRRREWLVLVVAIAVAWQLWNWRGKTTEVVDAPITLITSDRESLSCALDHPIGRYRCKFRAPGQPWPNPPAHDALLVQYLTPKKTMFLVPALFDQPELAARYIEEPPANAPVRPLRRFIAQCKLRLVERVDEVHVRWTESGGWSTESGAWVAEPIGCEVK